MMGIVGQITMEGEYRFMNIHSTLHRIAEHRENAYSERTERRRLPTAPISRWNEKSTRLCRPSGADHDIVLAIEQ